MRRSVSLGLRTLVYGNENRFKIKKVSHEPFSTFLGASVLRTSAEHDVSEGEEKRPIDVPIPNICYGKYVSVRTSIQGEVLSVVDPSFYSGLLKQFAELGHLRHGRMVHAHVFKSEFKDDVIINNNILYMYSKCGAVREAQKFFDEMPIKDTFTWTTMIIAYSQNGSPSRALLLFPQMLHLGAKPNKFTFSSLLKASRAVSTVKHGMHMHALCIKYGYDSCAYVGTALVDIYIGYGLMNEAELIFDGLLSKNEVSWNALIAGYARNDQGDKALNLFQRMKRETFEPDDFTYSSVLSSCASSGSLEQGKWIHGHVIKSGMTLVGFVGNTLLHMYAKCGSIMDAEKVFTRLTKQSVVSWNTMLTGYAQYGLGRKSVNLFDAMLKTKIQPNEITFLGLLTACSHAGLVDEGWDHLNRMKLFGLEPKVGHYVTMVDLFGRAGRLDEAVKFITNMPIEPVAEIWKALLGACRSHKNMELGVYAAKRVFELDPCDPGPYVILSNIYASAGRRADVAKVRMMMKECGVSKEPACSWVEIENVVHVFVADDHTHPQIKEIYKTWENISAKIKEIGYVPDTNQVLLFVEDREREVNLQQHSEKLALAFAILNTPPGSIIRIKKNIRMCVDCHSAIKFVSRVIKREILVRDTKRFHHFQNGSCSCGDYW
ncbi:pentatricopeptide repeat-containing protein At3g24000, mitochondrial-like isoform X1 [Silene latifolia]|uniref:pentatricopeptide repeat-containing protein At3g24000, mitochondrial-like isoform X1 n=1 Tax=Silene latifolia TaxID=37657 RepID=UPI003D773D94